MRHAQMAMQSQMQMLSMAGAPGYPANGWSGAGAPPFPPGFAGRGGGGGGGGSGGGGGMRGGDRYPHLSQQQRQPPFAPQMSAAGVPPVDPAVALAAMASNPPLIVPPFDPAVLFRYPPPLFFFSNKEFPP